MSECKAESIELNRVVAFDLENQLDKIDKKSPSTDSTKESSPTSSTDSGILPEDDFGIPPTRLTFEVEANRDNHVANQDKPLFIESRIIRNFKLKLMPALPTILDDFNLTSVITPDGLYQLDKDAQQFKQILDKDKLKSIGLSWLLDEASGVTEPKGIVAYDFLTLNQLNDLHRLTRSYGGFTITGFTLVEEFFLRLLTCNREFPPLPEAPAKRILNVVNTEIAHDLLLSLRILAHTAVIYGFIDNAYFVDTGSTLVDAYNFTIVNNNALLYGLLGIGILNFAFLRSGILEKSKALTIAHRFGLLLSTTIGYAENWDNYAGLILPENILLYGLFPIVVAGLVRGMYRHDRYSPDVIQLGEFGKLKFLWNALCYASTEASLWSLGMIYPINSIGFFFKNLSDPNVLKEYNDDLAAFRYSVFILALFANLARYPKLSIKCQTAGRYASSIITGVGEALLDNDALSIIMGMIVCSIYGENITYKQKGVLSMYFGLQIIIATFTFLVSFPNTQDLPEYSIYKSLNKTNTFPLWAKRIWSTDTGNIEPELNPTFTPLHLPLTESIHAH